MSCCLFFFRREIATGDFGAETHALSVLLDFLQKQSDAAESKEHACLCVDEEQTNEHPPQIAWIELHALVELAR